MFGINKEDVLNRDWRDVLDEEIRKIYTSSRKQLMRKVNEVLGSHIPLDYCKWDKQKLLDAINNNEQYRDDPVKLLTDISNKMNNWLPGALPTVLKILKGIKHEHNDNELVHQLLDISDPSAEPPTTVEPEKTNLNDIPKQTDKGKTQIL